MTAPQRRTPLALALCAGLGFGLAAGSAVAADAPAKADDATVLKAEVQRLSERLEALEKRDRAIEKSLATDNVSQYEPEVAARLKAVEFQVQSYQKQARQIEALEGISVGASVTGMVQRVNAAGTASGLRESRANYRGDLSITLPGGELGDAEGSVFAQLRFGQGTGIALRSTYTSTANTTAFETGAGADDSFAVMAQLWYQLTVPLPGADQAKANARDHLQLTAGKIDPFVFFDQNAMADDESTRFVNNAFVHNPLLDSGGDTAADAYGFQPGLVAKYENSHEKGSEWGLSLGVFAAGNGANFSGSLGRPFVIAQAETGVRLNYLPGRLRLYGWTNGQGSEHDGSSARHSGWGWSVDQKLDDDLTVFSRWGHQTRGAGRFDRAVTLGAELDGSRWHRAADGVGLAWGLLRTSAAYRDASAATLASDGTGYAARGSERPVELYYRYHLSETLEFTPNLQWVGHPGGDADAAAVKAVGLRFKLAI